MKKIIFVRHGQTDQNIIMNEAFARNANRVEGYYDRNLSLNSTGKKQIQEVAKTLKAEPLDVIFCSPLNRATETAEIINQYHNVPVISRDDLRERNTGDSAGEKFHELYDYDRNFSNEHIEPVQDFFARVFGIMDEISDSEYENILISAHNGVHCAIRAYCLKTPLEGNLYAGELANGEIRIYYL